MLVWSNLSLDKTGPTAKRRESQNYIVEEFHAKRRIGIIQYSLHSSFAPIHNLWEKIC